jgi:MFS family permease
MVYEGMRSVAGPFLGELGASAFTVGLVTGAGEAVALALRLVTGPWADHSGRHWRLTVVGYAMTAVCVPLLAVAPFVGAAGVVLASVLILLERTGKAVRSPAKSALLARMALRMGRGRGFAIHKALDQVGAFAGPLLVAGAAALTGTYWPGFALLAVPGAVSLLLLAQLGRRVPGITERDPEDDPPAAGPTGGVLRRVRARTLGTDLPRVFHLFSLSSALTTAGLMTFGVISYRLVDAGLVTLAAVPVVYALAMAVEAVAALATGELFDRWGPRVLLAVPVVVVAVPAAVLADSLAVVLVGVALWGAATGVQDSTVKAYVAGLVGPSRRATAYGIFAGVQGLGALAGGALAGALVDSHQAALVAGVAALQAVALGLLWLTLRVSRRGRAAAGPGPARRGGPPRG